MSAAARDYSRCLAREGNGRDRQVLFCSFRRKAAASGRRGCDWLSTKPGKLSVRQGYRWDVSWFSGTWADAQIAGW